MKDSDTIEKALIYPMLKPISSHDDNNSESKEHPDSSEIIDQRIFHKKLLPKSIDDVIDEEIISDFSDSQDQEDIQILDLTLENRNSSIYGLINQTPGRNSDHMFKIHNTLEENKDKMKQNYNSNLPPQQKINDLVQNKPLFMGIKNEENVNKS